MTVYVLAMILVTKTGFLTSTTSIDVQTAVFRDAAVCLENLERNKRELSKNFDQVDGTCYAREVFERK